MIATPLPQFVRDLLASPPHRGCGGWRNELPYFLAECKTCGVWVVSKTHRPMFCSVTCWQKSLREPMDESAYRCSLDKFLREFDRNLKWMRAQAARAIETDSDKADS
jgi:hypothetical protein